MKTILFLFAICPMLLIAQQIDNNGMLSYEYSAKGYGLNGKIRSIKSYVQPNEQIGYESFTQFDSSGWVTFSSHQSFQAGYKSPETRIHYYQRVPLLQEIVQTLKTGNYVPLATLQVPKATFQFIWAENLVDKEIHYIGDTVFITKNVSALLDTIQRYNKKNNFIRVQKNKTFSNGFDNYSISIIERNSQQQVLTYRFYFADTTGVQPVFTWAYQYDKKRHLVEIQYHYLKENQVQTTHYFRNKKTHVIDSVSIKRTKEASPELEKYTYNSDGTIQKIETMEYVNHYYYDNFKNWVEQIRSYKVPHEAYIERRTIQY